MTASLQWQPVHAGWRSRPADALARCGSQGAPGRCGSTLQAAGAKLALDGSIAQPEQMRGYTLKIDANVPDLAALAPFVPACLLPPLHDIDSCGAGGRQRQAPLPAISDVALHVGASDLSGTVGGLKIDKLDVTAPKPDQPVQVAMQGSFGEAPASLNGSVGIPPSLLSGGKLGGTRADRSDRAVALGSSVSGQGHGRPEPGWPADGAGHRSPDKLDADALMAALHSRPARCAARRRRRPAAPAAACSRRAARPPPRPAKGRMFPDTPLPFDLLRMADADVTLTIGEL